MNIKQQSHFKMLVTVAGVLDKFKTLWQAVLAFAAARTDLAAAIDAVAAEELKQAGVTTGVAENKRVARQAMCRAAALVAGAVAAWADKQNNHELFNLVDYSAADLLHQPEQACLTQCKVILDAATANLPAVVAEKTLAQTDLDDLTAKIGAFKTLLTKPREAKASTKGATNLLPEKLDAADRIVERQLDRLMPRYQTSNPDFYEAYHVARIIVDIGGGPGTPPTPPTTPPK